jgi:hypothetical protein
MFITSMLDFELFLMIHSTVSKGLKPDLSSIHTRHQKRLFFGPFTPTNGLWDKFCQRQKGPTQPTSVSLPAGRNPTKSVR